MIIAIMQPYLLPYIGYFQLMNKVNKFVVYDDVTFIKKGWINRNNIVIDGTPHLFSVPIEDISSFKLIKDTKIDKRLYPHWRKKFFKTIFYNYRHAPYYEDTKALLDKVFEIEPDYISCLALHSLKTVSGKLGIEAQLIDSSTVYGNDTLKGVERVLDICKREGADVYINPIGGKELYSKEQFKEHGIDLYFIKSKEIKYDQMREGFNPNLSIIDVMMFNPVEKIKEYLNEYELI